MIVDMRRGDKGYVYLDGKPVRAVRARTGVKGYALCYVEDENGTPKLNKAGNGFVRHRKNGRVQFFRRANGG